VFKKICLTTALSGVVLFSSAGAALAAAGGTASCIGIGASVTATTGGSIPGVLAIVRGILGTPGVGAWVSPAAAQHQGTVEACFPNFPPAP
jgi:hypothetical protein